MTDELPPHLSQWTLTHWRTLSRVIKEMLHQPITNLMTILVISIVIALPTGLYVFLNNSHGLYQKLSEQAVFSIFLAPNTPPPYIVQIITDLKQRSAIKRVAYISPQQGFSELQHSPDFKMHLDTVDIGVIPPVIIVTPQQNIPLSRLHQINDFFQKLPHVDSVKISWLWVKRLAFISTFGKRIVYSITALSCLGLILIISNTIQLSIMAYLDEMTTMKMLGASHGFLRRPFLYRGFLFGLFGGSIAYLIVCTLLSWLTIPLENLAQTYDFLYKNQTVNKNIFLFVTVTAIIISMVGSSFAIRRHLKP